MSEETTTPEPEPEVQPSRIAGAIAGAAFAVIAIVLVRLVVIRVPYVAYFVAGIIVGTVWQRARARLAKRREGDSGVEEETEEAAPPDVAETLRLLSMGQHHVLLTSLQRSLGVADTKAVRKLLKADGIRVRPGVRTPAGNGPGVHHDDIPPAPLSPTEAHGEGCCCRSANNTNANNETEDPSQKGLSVEAIGQAGTLIRDPSEAQQRQTQVTELVHRFFNGAEQKQRQRKANNQ